MGISRELVKILIIGEAEVPGLDQLWTSSNFNCQVVRAQSKIEFQELLSSSWNLIVYHSRVTFLNPRSAFDLLKLSAPAVPLIYLTHEKQVEEIAEIMKAGAHDIVSESNPQRLLQIIEELACDEELLSQQIRIGQAAQEAIASREQMLAIVSHDIRNPLSAIDLEAQMLFRVADRNGNSLFSEEVKIQANRILKITSRLKSLITDLLDKNKTEDSLSTLQKADCDVAKIIQEVVDANRPLMKEKNLLLKTAFVPQAKLEVDKNKIFQALYNLLSNAIKFAPENGMIEIAIDDLGEEFRFSVSDNGPGLNTADLKRVFEKYWTAGVSGRSGTGLGLFICKTIVDAHRGQIGGENLAAGGARFWFTLPKPNATADAGRTTLNKPKILLIDDDHDLREVISWALDLEGYAVQAFADPLDALESLRLEKKNPQLIVVDFQMDSMTGTEFLKQKKAIEFSDSPDCPVVMISASPQEINHEENDRLISTLLTKPLDLGAFIRNVKSYISA